MEALEDIEDIHDYWLTYSKKAGGTTLDAAVLTVATMIACLIDHPTVQQPPAPDPAPIQHQFAALPETSDASPTWITTQCHCDECEAMRNKLAN